MTHHRSVYLMTGRFYGFGVLPTTNIEASCKELEEIAKSSKLRGIILSTQGIGKFV